ncbi:MAG TPA: hypothetical protein HA282_04240 [Nanoarchaeota archaeon]|nr:hypothetical protein [Nanoarchaeota archaeon]HIH33725.1 hypothetical protein [Nanoarchaeota archaeon]HIH51184.1 hypothetical protein [Nanoarchaeota archaeon]HIH66396.1 hypothetical protein [Nanoarchaeota archaeon]
MDFPKIKKYLGEEWLNRQIKIIEGGMWIEDPKGMDTKDIIPVGYFILEEINKLITKFEEIKGFDKWVKEARTSKQFKTCLFELMSIEAFIDKSDFIELKKENDDGVPEAFVKKGEYIFFLECTLLDELKSSFENKAADLFKKSTKKFRNSEGIHLVGAFDFFGVGKLMPTTNFHLLKRHINSRFSKGRGSATIAYIITNFYFTINPETKKMYSAKEYWLILNPNKGEYDTYFFKNVMSVKDFITY